MPSRPHVSDEARRSLSVAVAVLVVLLAVSAGIMHTFHDDQEEASRSTAQHLGSLGIRRIEIALERCADTTRFWESILVQNGGDTSDFESTSEGIIQQRGDDIVAIALAPGGVVSEVDESEDVLDEGLDVTADPRLAEAAEQAALTGETALATVARREGGGRYVAFVTPVTISGDGGSGLWGYSLAVYRFPEALGSADLEDFLSGGYRYRLEARASGSDEGEVVSASDDADSMDDPIVVSVATVGRTWSLSVEPSEGWVPVRSMTAEGGLLLLVDVSFSLFAFYLASLVQRRRSLEELSYTDDLTGLSNTRAYHDALAALDAGEAGYAVFFLDLDRFKAVNDNYGHEAGNELLEVTARRIASCVRPTDPAFRIGGDEFVVVVRGELNAGECADLARRLIEAVEQPVMVQGMLLRVGASVGYARFPEDGSESAAVVAAADECMYQAKQVRHRAAEQAGAGLDAALARLSAFDLSRESRRTPTAFLVYRVSGDGELLYVNEGVLSLYGCSSLDEFLRLTGGSFVGTMLPEDVERVRKAVRLQLDTYSHNLCFASYRVRARDGSVRNVDHYGYLVRNEEYGRLGYVFLAEVGAAALAGDGGDEQGQAGDGGSELVAGSRPISPGIVAMDGSDRLTSLCNRYYYEMNAAQVAEGIRERAGTPAVAFLDLENFKSYNLRHGYQGGDELLCAVADVLRTTFPDDLVCRFEGDHFVVVAEASGLAGRVQGAHDELSRDAGVELRAGICEMGSADEDPAAAHDKAKFACDSIKGTYDHCVRTYDEELARSLSMRAYIVESLPRALSEEWVEVYYQPVVRVLSGKLCSVEALTRWRDPTYGLISPADFVPALEDAHLINRLDAYMARHVCQDLHDALEAGGWVVPVSLNLSRLDFELMDAPSMVTSVMGRYGIPERLVHVEVTESALAKNPAAVGQGIEHLHEAGLEVWMDDFGSGFSSLNLLKDYDFDMLKIDMEFMRTVETSERSRVIVSSIVALAKQLGIHTLAEGVETERQRDFLREVGCERIQGYLYGRPMPLEDLRAEVAEGRLAVEPAELAGYYGRVGLTSLTLLGRQVEGGSDGRAGTLAYDGPALAIVERVGADVRLLSWTRSFPSLLEDIGFATLGDFEARVEHDLAHSGSIRKLSAKARETGKVEGESVVEAGKYCNIYLGYLTSHGDRAAYVLGITENTPSSALDDSLLSLYRVFGRVDVFDLGSGGYHNLYLGEGGRRVALGGGDLDSGLRRFAAECVHPDDRAAYLAFMDPATVGERIDATASGMLSGTFRTLGGDGRFEPWAYSLLKVRQSGRSLVVSASRRV